ncbi:glycosyltransferase [Virgibacillus oceani]
MHNMNPKISIIMGIYNCAATLHESIDSLLNQTYTNWELIMCEDGSTDDTLTIAKKYAKKNANIFLIQNEKNLGLAHSLNKCMEVSKGEYIARQDGDDLSKTDRLERQVQVLDNHAEFDIVSSGMILFDENGYWGKINSVEVPQASDFMKQSPFCHAPSMMRKKALLNVGGYNTNKRTYRAEDYDLWFRMYANGSRGYNIQAALYEVRDDRNAIKRRKYKYRINEAYVRFHGYRRLKFKKTSYLYVFRAIIVGLVPSAIYKLMRRRKYNLH